MTSVEINGYNTRKKLRCSIQDLPENIIGQAAISSSNGTLYCGGINPNFGRGLSTSKKCWRLNDQQEWRKFKPLKIPRADFTINQIKNRLVAVGSSKPRLGDKPILKNSLEYIDLGSENDWKEKVLDDFFIHDHCSVTLKDQFILLIGGMLNGEVSEIN